VGTLLVIDDDPLVRGAFQEAYRRTDHTVRTAATGSEGLSLVAEQRPDVIVTDLGLPDMKGLEVFRRVQQIDPRIPVIILTGTGSSETAIEAMRFGAFDYQVKPFDLPRMRGLIARAFKTSRLARVPVGCANNLW
jgi:DNA-binding NtrC family response regulator